MSEAQIKRCVERAVHAILDSWSEWESEAGQDAQQAQDADAWDFIMEEKLREAITDAFLNKQSSLP